MIKKYLSVLLSILIVISTPIMVHSTETVPNFSTDIKNISIEIPELNEIKPQILIERNSEKEPNDPGSTPDSFSPPYRPSGTYDFVDYNYNWNWENEISWDYKSKTLTLNNANFSCSSLPNHTYGIILPADSTIILIGENTITTGESYGEKTESCGIVCEGNLNICGSGSLEVESGKAPSYSCGIFAVKDITISDCSKIKIHSGEAGVNSSALYAKSINISNTLLSLSSDDCFDGTSCGITCIGKLTLDNARVSACSGTAPFNSGIFARIVYSTKSHIYAQAANIPVYLSYGNGHLSIGISCEEYIAASLGEIIAYGGKVFKNGDKSASVGVACYDLEMLGNKISAFGGESSCYSIGIFCENLALASASYFNVLSKPGVFSVALSSNDITINGYYLSFIAEGGSYSSVGLNAKNSISINGGKINISATGNNNNAGIIGTNIFVNSGDIHSVASKSDGESYGIIGNLKINCGDIRLIGQDAAISGGIICNSPRINIKGRTSYDSGELQDATISSNKIVLPNENNASPRFADITFDFDGEEIYAYMLNDNELSYKEEDRIMVHSKNSAVFYQFESSDNSIIRVDNSVFGVITAIDEGIATISVSAIDAFEGDYIRDENGDIATYKIDITCKMTFWEKIVRFFRNLFGLD